MGKAIAITAYYLSKCWEQEVAVNALRSANQLQVAANANLITHWAMEPKGRRLSS